MISRNINDDSTLSYLFNRVWDKLYPVGAIYISSNATSPEKLFGGKWKQIEDQFLLAAGRTYRAGDTGGEAAHTLNTNELPRIYGEARMGWPDSSAVGIMVSETYGVFKSKAGTAYYVGGINSGTYGTTLVIDVGGGQAHNNMPPYRVVYAWERTA